MSKKSAKEIIVNGREEIREPYGFVAIKSTLQDVFYIRDSHEIGSKI